MFFWLSKIGWFLLSPANLILILSVAGGLAALAKWRRLGAALMIAALFVFAVCGLTPVGVTVVAELEDRFRKPAELPERVSGIVVLGGLVNARISAARGETAVGSAVERLIAAADLAARYPGVPVVYTGGSGALVDTESREADHVARLAGRLGLPESRLILERNARNTHENAREAKAVLPAESVHDDPEKPWILVTSAQHMPRAMGVFRTQGWHVLAYPVDYATEGVGRVGFAPGLGAVRWAGRALYEVLGLVSYYATGKTDSLYPAPES